MTHARGKVAYAASLALLASFSVTDVQGGGAQSRPMAGACETEFAFAGPTTVLLAGTCHLRHLGLVSVEATQEVVFNTDGTVSITHTTVYTAANGDELFATVTATGQFLSATAIGFSGTETYSGGTGRFLNAAGGGDVIGGAQFTSAYGGVGAFSVNGTLGY